jgi:hypothetical protein
LDNDFGGVHNNSGVNNKLCCLLTDGDTFNGQTVQGLGLTRVAELYYEAQINLLTPVSDWTGLYHALRQAAINRGWSQNEQNNLVRACLAVQIATFDGDAWVDKNIVCLAPETGASSCTIVPPAGPFKTVARGVSDTPGASVLHIRSAHYNEANVTINKFLQLRAESGPVTIGRP